MSRTEGILLPRLPTSHAKVVSSNAIKPLSRKQPRLFEPNYTAFVGTPRQDIPHQIYSNAAMFDDVFEKQGHFFTGRNTPKVTCPLNSLQYNSLHDPHCKSLFLNNQTICTHLIQLGMLTDDLRVISTTKEQRQRIRAHELLERKEQLTQKMNEKEKKRLEKIKNNQSFELPHYYRKSLQQAEEKKLAWEALQKMKVKKALQNQEASKRQELEKKKERKHKLHVLMKKIEFEEQTCRNFAHLKQQEIEIRAYEGKYGKIGVWHKESDSIHNRIVLMSKTKWAKGNSKEQTHQIRSFPVQSPVLTQPHKDDKLQLVDTPETKREEIQAKQDDKQEPKGRSDCDLKELIENEKSEETKARSLPQSEPLVNSNLPSLLQPAAISIPVPLEQMEINQKIQQNEQILVDYFKELLMMGDNGYGYISFDNVYHILSSNDLDLPLDHDELIILTENLYGQVATDSDMILINQAALLLPQLLVNIFSERMKLQLTQYGMLVEESWLQFSPSTFYLYMNKMTGWLQTERPSDYRPFLKNDPFEDVISGLFLTADVNRDGYIDDTDFHTFLQSPYMNERVYTEQIEEILSFYTELAIEGGLSLEQFVPLAQFILQIIYSLAHPNEEWIEVDLKKGNFFYNPSTGKHNTNTPIEKPPALRKRTKSFNLFETINKEDKSFHDKETRNLIEEVAEKLQTGVRIIDTIPEEDGEKLLDLKLIADY